jgi:hypothetical protein
LLIGRRTSKGDRTMQLLRLAYRIALCTALLAGPAVARLVPYAAPSTIAAPPRTVVLGISPPAVLFGPQALQSTSPARTITLEATGTGR